MRTSKKQILRICLLVIECILAALSLYVSIKRGIYNLSMTWVFNIAADTACMFINLFFIMGTLFGRKLEGKRYDLYLTLCFFNFLALFFDMHSWLFDGFAQYRNLIIFINTGLYIVNLFLTAAFAYFLIESLVEDVKRKKVYTVIINFMLAVTVITRILNVKYGYFFYVDEAGVYHRGPYQYMAYAFTFVAEIMILSIILKEKSSRKQKIAVLSFMMFPIIAVLISFFSYGLSVTYAAVTISIVMIYSAFFLELESDKDRLEKMLGKFVSNEVVQELVDNPEDILVPGKRYLATIFVSDIRSFTVLSETLSPQDLVTMLNHYFGVVTETVAGFGGIVTEFLGDGIMCIFGAPNTCRDHAEKAIAAALTLQGKLPEINQWNAEHGYPMIETGIGINTGTILLGSLGNSRGARYTAVGDTVDKTFQIESCSLGGQVLVSNTTLKAARTEVEHEFVIDYAQSYDQLTSMRIYEVYHIGGEWNVGKKRMIVKPSGISSPIDAKFRIIIGKHTDVQTHAAKIKRLSEDGLGMETYTFVTVLDNIRIDIPDYGTVFAKVKEVNGTDVTAYFTSRPGWLGSWVQSHRNK